MDFKNILEGTRPFFQGLPFQGLPSPSPTTAQLLPSQSLPLKDGGHLRKFEEGLGATLSQMYSNTSAPQAATPSSSCSPNNNGNQVSQVGCKGVSSSRSSSSAQSLTPNQVQNAGTSNPPVFNMVVRRESPLDLSVKTVRQSADSSTSSAVIDGGISGNSVANRSLSSSGASTPINTTNNNTNSNSSSSNNNNNNMSSVIAAAANSTTNLLKDHHHQGHGSSSSSSSHAERSKSKKNSTPIQNASNSTPTEQNLSLNSPHHLFGHSVHPPTTPHNVHNAVPRPVVHSYNPPAQSSSGPGSSSGGSNLNLNAVGMASEVSQQNHHLLHSQQQHQHHPQQQQQSQQSQQRPSSVIPPYNPPPAGLSPYHQYHQTPSQHHHPAYHHVAYSQYHFPGQSQPTNNNHAGAGQQQQHLGYYPPYGHGHTPISIPSAPPQVQSSSSGGANSNNNHHASSRDSSSARNSASQNPQQQQQTHSQVASGATGINYPPPGKASVAAHPSTPLGGSHYQVPPQSAYYPPPQHGPHNPYYSNTTTTATNRPPQEATNIQQHQSSYPGQPPPPSSQQQQHGYGQNYNHYPTAQSQLPQSFVGNYHYPHQLHHPHHQQPPPHLLSSSGSTPNSNNPGVVNSQQSNNPSNFPSNLVVGRGSSSVNLPRPLPSAIPNHSMPMYQSSSSDPNGVNPGSATSSISLKTTPQQQVPHPHNHLVSSVPPPPNPQVSNRTSNTKQGHSRGTGKASSRKNLLSLLRNSCETRIHEKQEKEKFQFNHQTWNFHGVGRKFNTALPPLGNNSNNNTTVSNCTTNGGESNLLIGITSTTTAPNMGTAVHAQQPTSLQIKSERDSLALFSGGSDNGAQNYNSLSTLNRIRTKAEKKQLFPNLISQIEQENSSRASVALGLGGVITESENNNSSSNVNNKRGKGFMGKGGLKQPATSVFDFQDDDDDSGNVVKTNSAIKTMKKSPVKNSRGLKKDFVLATPTLPVQPKSISMTTPTTTTTMATNSFYTKQQEQQSGLVCNRVEIHGKDLLTPAIDPATALIPNKSQPSTSIDNIDNFWDACDSFLTDLASNPTTIKSRRGGLWQKLKSKTNNSKNTKTPKISAVHQSKVKRTLKNSSEEDSDFKVDSVKSEVEEEDDDEESVEENSDMEDDDVENSSNGSEETQSKSDEVVISTSRKRKQPTQNSRKSSPASSIIGTKRRKSSNNNNNTNNKNENIISGKTRGRTTTKTVPQVSGGRRRSKRKLSSGMEPSAVSEEDATSRTSIGSESEENSDNSDSSSFSVGSFDSDSDNSDDSSSGRGRRSDDDNSDSSASDYDSDSASSDNLRKSKRNKSLTASPNTKSKNKKIKSLRNSTKSKSMSVGRRRSNRSSSKKSKKSSSRCGRKTKTRRGSQDDSVSNKRNSVKTQSLRRKLRPKRNCAPVAGKGRLRDISGESGDEGQQGGSSGEEWIMRGELGKKGKRGKKIFGDGSDFRRPGWEEELIDFKKKLRMPSKLIRVAKPSSLSASTSVVGGGNSSSSSVSKDFDSQDTTTGEQGSKVTKDKEHGNSQSTEKDQPGKKTKGRQSKSTPTKVETKLQPNTRNTTTTTPSNNKSPGPKGKASKENKSSSKEVEEKIEKGVKNLKEKQVESVEITASTTKTPTKSPNKRDKNVNKKNTPEKVNKTAAVNSTPVKEQPVEIATALIESNNKKDEDRYSKLTKEKEAQMLPTPGVTGAAGNKFNKKMSIKSVFGVDLPNQTPPPVKKSLKGPRRNKFKSGFDYIRKKKRVTATPDGVVAPVPPKRIKTNVEKTLREEDVQAEMRGWVLNKGLGETILHRAARLGYPDVASYCLEHDMCSPNSKDNAGYSPLHETCIKGNLSVAKVLLAYGANVSQAAPGGIRPLHEACENGHVELVRLLVSYGADPLLATYAGQSPLELAEPFLHVKTLLEEHIKDIQGKQDTPWIFKGSGCWAELDNGFDVTGDMMGEFPSADDTSNEPETFEFEASESPLPPLYRLKGEVSFYVLLQDLLNYIGQTKDRFLKNNPAADVVELNSNDFLEQAHCCHLLGEKFNLNSSSDLLTLIKYDCKVKKMLNIESCTV